MSKCDVVGTKKSLRKQMRELNRGLESQHRHELSEYIFTKVESTPQFAAAETIAFFSALPDEPATATFIEKWAHTKTILLPKVDGEQMDFYEYGHCDLRTGAFGILEPTAAEPVAPTAIDLMIVPGVAFSTEGERLGRGKGFYDRYLARCSQSMYKIGVCYPHQIVEELPCEAHDVRMNRIIE